MWPSASVIVSAYSAIGVGCVVVHKIFFRWLPILCVCVCVDLSVCVICVSDVLGVVYKELDNLWCMFVLDSHLSTYVKLSLATWNSLFYVIC